MSAAIIKLLEPKAVLLNTHAKSAMDIITILGTELFNSGYVKETFISAAIEREKIMPTGLPLLGGINAAIPHTDIEHVIKPGLAMATLQDTVDFQNMIAPEEHVAVRLVFLLALEQPKAQVKMLQEVAGVLQSPEVVLNLIKAKSYAEAIKALELM